MHPAKYLWPAGAVLALLLLLPAGVFGFSATARVDNTRISSRDTVRFQVVVDGGKARVDLSGLTDFDVLSSGTSTSKSYTNGEWRHQVAYTHILAPKKNGVLIIPPLSVSRDGESVMTREIRIMVSDAATEDPGGREFFAEAGISDPEIVPGQQAVYTLRLFVSRNFAGASFDPPEFTGLDARELTKWKKYTRNIGGQVFGVNEIRFLVQGEAPGEFEISPAVFMAKKDLGAAGDPFGSFFDDSSFRRTRTKPVRVVSNPVRLRVSPMPAYTGDHPFSGLVGRFTVSASLDKAELRVGESATLTIVVQGTGNVMDAGLPSLELDPDRFKVYEDSPVEEIRAGENGLTGKKTFKQALVPNVPGRVTIPPVRLTYYDTASGDFTTVSGSPVAFEVLPGDPPPAAATPEPSSARGASNKQEVVLKNRDILDIREDISAITTDSPLPMHWFVMLLALPGTGFVLSVWALGMRRREKSPGEVLKARARSQLAAAARLDPGDAALPGLLQAALTAAVLSAGGRPSESVTREEARELLEAAAADPEVIRTVLDLMAQMDAARFGGASVAAHTVRNWRDQVLRVVKALCLALCVGTLVFQPFAAPPARAGDIVAGAPPADLAGLFIDSARAYNAGNYLAAAQGFEAIAKTGVKNPDLFYNTGNAWFKAGDIGRSLLWYERAGRLSPGDPDLGFNLAHVRTLVRDKVDDSPVFWHILFFWQGLVSLKLLQFMAIGGSVVFFSWAGFRRAGNRRIFNAAGVCICCLALALASAAGLEAYRLNAASSAVILKDTVAVRSGTLDTATPLFDLHAGTRVRVLEKKGTHLKIRFGKDKVGWVAAGEAEVI